MEKHNFKYYSERNKINNVSKKFTLLNTIANWNRHIVYIQNLKIEELNVAIKEKDFKSISHF